LTLPVYLASFEWMRVIIAMFDQTSAGYTGFNLARYGVCLAVMLPATFCAGMTLPLITKILLTAGLGERAIGWVYGVNTVGSIAGVVLAGLLWLLWVGLKVLLIIGAACDMAVGVLLLASGMVGWPADIVGSPAGMANRVVPRLRPALVLGGATVL